jgi:hypothetical protein
MLDFSGQREEEEGQGGGGRAPRYRDFGIWSVAWSPDSTQVGAWGWGLLRGAWSGCSAGSCAVGQAQAGCRSSVLQQLQQVMPSLSTPAAAAALARPLHVP